MLALAAWAALLVLALRLIVAGPLAGRLGCHAAPLLELPSDRIPP
jgi:hypothetical protein